MPLLVISDKIHHPVYQILPFEIESLEPHCPDLTCHIKGCYSDIVLVDSGFEPEIGLQLLKDIKTMRPDLPVVFLTDASSEDMVIRAFKGGAREYFKKPFDMFELEAAIIRLIEIVNGTKEERYTEKENLDIPKKKSTASIFDKPPNILRVINFIDGNLSENIDIARLASKAHLSKYHFCRVFKKSTGMSPVQYVISRRIEKAKELLGSRDSKISKISTESGFSDLSNFTRHFKRHTGMTPTDYKNSLLNLYLFKNSNICQ